MPKAKYYKTVVQVVVLSEGEPVEFEHLGDLHYLIDQGPCVGHYSKGVSNQITERQMEEELAKAGSTW
jgi:hypothetical protein